ncbi:hypothetical protein ACFLTT_03765, partial [Chloroflexota bacterium]
IEYNTANATGTAEIKWATIMALEVSNTGPNRYYNAEANTENTTTTTEPVYDTAVELNFTPVAGDYLFLATAVSRNDVSKKEAYVQFTSVDTHSPLITGSTWGSWAMAENHTLSATSYNSTIEFATGGSGGAAHIKDARITVVPLSVFGDTYNASTVDQGITSSSTYVDFATANVTLANRLDCYILASGLGRQNTNNDQYYAQITIDDNVTGLGEYIFQTEDKDIYRSFFMARRVNLASGSHQVNLQHKAGGSDVYSKEFHIVTIEANTAESYSSDSIPTPIDDGFTTGENPFIRAYGLQPDHDYTVGYYDENGDKVSSDVNSRSSATGNISSQYIFPNEGEAPGTWHAVVFDGSSSVDYATANSTKSNNGYVTEDTFEVYASAIPEFPGIIAVLTVTGMCFAVYLWMRKKRPAYGSIKN